MIPVEWEVILMTPVEWEAQELQHQVEVIEQTLVVEDPHIVVQFVN